MAGLDDLYKALGVFQEGMQQFAITQGVNQATQAVDQLNQAGLSELQKRQEQQKIAQQLAMRMTQAGANASQIQTAVGAIGPTPIKDSNDAYQQAVATGDKDLMKMAKDMQGFENKPGMDKQDDQQSFLASESAKERQLKRELAVAKKDNKLSDQELKQVMDAQKKLESSAKKNFEGYTQAQIAGSMLDELGQNPVAMEAIKTFLARATGEVGNLTDAEREAFGGSRAIIQRVRRMASKLATGLPTEEDKKELRELTEVFASSNKRAIEGTADRMAKQLGAATGRDAAELRSRILPADWSGSPSTTPKKPAGTPITVKGPDGKLIKAIKLPNGKLVKAQ